MYRKPKNLDPRIDDELYEKLTDIANTKYEAFLSFGSPYDHFERAVISAAEAALKAVDEELDGQAIDVTKSYVIHLEHERDRYRSMAFPKETK